MMGSSENISRRISSDGRRLLAFLRKRRQALSPLLILTHDYPDPDSIASALTLKVLAEDAGIQCRIAHGGTIGRTENRSMVSLLKIPLRRLNPTHLSRYEHVALVDTQPLFRNNRFPESRRAAIVIDQHRSVSPPDADLAIINEDCGATSVILARALLLSGIRPSPSVATALAYGILTDTMNFFRTNDKAVMDVYMDLLPFCDLPMLARIQNPDRSGKFFVTLSRAIRRSIACGPLLVSHLGDIDMPDLVSQTADFFLSYDRVKWAFATGRYRGRLYMSLRGKRNSMDAGEVLRDACGKRANAGGHGSIAGGRLDVGRDAPEAAWRAEENGLLVRLLERLRVSRRNTISFPFHERPENL